MNKRVLKDQGCIDKQVHLPLLLSCVHDYHVLFRQPYSLLREHIIMLHLYVFGFSAYIPIRNSHELTRPPHQALPSWMKRPSELILFASADSLGDLQPRSLKSEDSSIFKGSALRIKVASSEDPLPLLEDSQPPVSKDAFNLADYRFKGACHQRNGMAILSDGESSAAASSPVHIFRDIGCTSWLSAKENSVFSVEANPLERSLRS